MSLREKSFSGFLWIISGTVGNGLFSIIITILLARLLTPHDFAIIELITIFVGVSNIIIESGFSQAVIRDENPSSKDYSSIFYFNICFSFVFYFLLFLIIPLLASFFKAKELETYAPWAFLVIIFDAFSIIQISYLNRQLEFRAISLINIFSMIVTGTISVIMAFCDYGIWSLLANLVLFSLFKTICFWIVSKWRPILSFSFSSIKKYFSFGFFLLIESLVDTVVNYSMSAVIGRCYTKKDLGYYSQGKKVDYYVGTPIVGAIKRVTYPVFSQIRGDRGKLEEGYETIISIIIFVLWPLSLFEIITADNIIDFFLGSKWHSAAFFLKVSAISGFLYPIQALSTNILLVNGQSRKYMILSLLRQGFRITSLFLLIGYDLRIVVFWFVLFGCLGSCIIIYFGLKELKMNILKFKVIREISLPLIFSSAIVYFIPYFLMIDSTFIILVTQSVLMVVIYTLFSYFTKVSALSELVSLIKLYSLQK